MSPALRDKTDLQAMSHFVLLHELQVASVTMHLSEPEENFCTASPDFSGTTGILKRFQLLGHKNEDRETKWPAVTE